mmetsp:Transcript_13273/g.26963  ORF Transcript_13273/g.26963 Transcript_13273/m.26963 type:complete len:80 (+) Transcript_13273:524-763(+)
MLILASEEAVRRGINRTKSSTKLARSTLDFRADINLWRISTSYRFFHFVKSVIPTAVSAFHWLSWRSHTCLIHHLVSKE